MHTEQRYFTNKNILPKWKYKITAHFSIIMTEIMGYRVITWEISKFFKSQGMTKTTLHLQLYAKGSHFLNSVQRCSVILLCIFLHQILFSNKLTSLLLATHCTFPRALSALDLGGLIQGEFLKLTLETLEKEHQLQGLLLVSIGRDR